MKRKAKKHANSSIPRMPKWTTDKMNEEISEEFIKTVFHGWRPTSLQVNDIGLDIRFEIIDPDGSAMGAEFSVQLKAARRPKVSGGAIAYSIKTSTANYFLARSELVLFAVYDVQKKKGYWICIQEYLRQNWSPKWEQQETITIRIPSDNILDERARTLIERRVRWHHEQHKWVTAARTASNPYFKYEVSTDEQQISVDVSPKYPGALSDRPIEISGTLRFDTNTPEGTEAFAKLERHIKTGEELELDDRFFEGFRLPNALSDFFAPHSNFKTAAISIRPIPSKDIHPVRYMFVSGNGEVKSEIPYVELRAERAGTEQVLLSNADQQIPYRVRVLLANDGRAQIKIDANTRNKSAREVLNMLGLQSVLASGGKVTTEFLKTGHTATGSVPPGSLEKPESWLVNLAENLVVRQGKNFG